jgi:hypothetical protein
MREGLEITNRRAHLLIGMDRDSSCLESCKMAALPTWAYVQAQGDSYLFPLAHMQLPDAESDRYLQPF